MRRVEYQRQVARNLPACERVLVDPSAVLIGPDTERVRLPYWQGSWTPPTATRVVAWITCLVLSPPPSYQDQRLTRPPH